MANLQNWKDRFEATITALDPPDDSSALNYRWIDSLIEERGHGQHREFLWRAARLGRLVGETPLEVEWTVPLEFYLHRNNRTYEAFVSAYEDEAKEILIAWSGMTNDGADVWTSNFDRFETREIEPERPARAGGVPRYEVARVTFMFRVHTSES